MKMTKRARRRVGDVVSIDLGEGRFGFAVVLKEPLFGYYDYSSDAPAPPLSEIVASPIAFKVCTMRHHVVSGRWPVIGRIEISDEDAALPWFFKEDSLTNQLSKTRDGTEELPVTEEEAMQMERAAVWEPDHVVDRLRDHFAGVPNKWVESLKPRGRHKRMVPPARA